MDTATTHFGICQFRNDCKLSKNQACLVLGLQVTKRIATVSILPSFNDFDN